jgi:hypothetical protein
MAILLSKSKMTSVLGRKPGCMTEGQKKTPKVKEETLPCCQFPATRRWFDFLSGLSELHRRAILYELYRLHTIYAFEDEKVKK